MEREGPEFLAFPGMVAPKIVVTDYLVTLFRVTNSQKCCKGNLQTGNTLRKRLENLFSIVSSGAEGGGPELHRRVVGEDE